jgi:DNA-binding protein HU-beta
VNKSELIDAMSARSELSKADAERALNAFIDSVQTAVADNDKVVLPGFGSFQRVERSARVGRNPQTGEPVQIKASKSAKFTVGKKFKDQVSGN